MNLTDAANAFTSMLHAIDAKNWDSVRHAFADSVHMDYSSLFGDPAATVAADDQVAGWRAFAGAFDVTQHITGPIIATADGADVTASTHVRAYHRIQGAEGGDVWMVAGHYDVRLTSFDGKWKIAAITLTVFYQEGNLAIPQIARDRAAAPR